MIDGIFDPAMSSLEKGIKNAVKAQEVIAQNIANANTPNYYAKKFDEVLEKEVQRRDVPGVNLEEEMADQAKNSGKHAAYIKLLLSKLSILRTIITQGRK